MSGIGSWFCSGRWCLGCNEYILSEVPLPAPSLCPECHDKLPWFKRELCFFCGHHHNHGDCDQSLSRKIEEYRAIFYYQEPVNQWISSLKYSRNLLKGRTLKELVTQWFVENALWIEDFDVLVPVPLHSGRLWNRGFNQTSYLIRDQQMIEVNEKLVRKVKRTKHQAALSGKHRFSNLKRSFQADPSVKGLDILLFDDVCTTGQTLDQMAVSLKKAGAGRISAVSVARTQSPWG